MESKETSPESSFSPSETLSQSSSPTSGSREDQDDLMGDGVDRVGSDDLHASRLHAAQIELLYSRKSASLAGAWVVSLLLGITFWDVVPHSHIIVWVLAMTAIYLGRHAMTVKFHRLAPTGEAVIRWGTLFAIASAASGAMWGAAAWFLFPDQSLLHQGLLVVFMAGICSGTATVYAPVKSAYIPYLLLASVPMAARFFLEGTFLHFLLGTLTVVYTASMVTVGNTVHATTRRYLELQFEKDNFIDRLSQQKIEAERLNETLKTEIRIRQRAENALKEARNNLEQTVKERTAELEESEAKYRTIIENMGEAYYELDLAGNLIFLNESGRKMLGYEGDEFIGENLRQHMSDKDSEEAIIRYRHVFEQGDPLDSADWVLISRDGTRRDVEVSASLIRDSGGQAIGFRGIARDVTVRKREEKELLKMEKLSSLGLLAGGIAHDFNNILTAIQGNLSFAKMVSKDVRVRRQLEEAERAGVRARDLTHQLLTFSKGGAPIRKAAAISEIISDSCNFALRGSNIRCELSIPDDVLNVDVDAGQINQVIHNIVLNAAQAMPEGGSVEVSCRNISVSEDLKLSIPDGQYVKITIVDHGPGISEKHLSRIFDPYFSTKSTGSGLGLSTAYSIVGKHRGLIAVESEPGRGSTFHIYLPATEEESQTEDDSRADYVYGEGKILVMDDEKAIRDLAKKILSKLGYEVVPAKDGSEAIDLYVEAMNSSRPFDAVILDLTVPGGMGGKETIKKLTELDPEVSAIVSSGYSTDPIMADYERYGFQDVLPKPYEGKALSRVLSEVIQQSDLQTRSQSS